MSIQLQGNSGVIAEVEAGSRALRVTPRPIDYGTLGHYGMSETTAAYTTLAAGSILFSARWGDATRLAIVYRFGVTVMTATAFTAPQITDRSLFFTRAFTASDTGGAAISLAGNNQKARTSMGSSLYTDMRIHGGAITAGTGTDDARAFGKAVGWSSAVGTTIPPVDLIQDNGGISHPIVLAQNEGLRIRIPTVMGAAGVQQSHFDKRWAELASY